jgi:hypothetical protein
VAAPVLEPGRKAIADYNFVLRIGHAYLELMKQEGLAQGEKEILRRRGRGEVKPISTSEIPLSARRDLAPKQVQPNIRVATTYAIPIAQEMLHVFHLVCSS